MKKAIIISGSARKNSDTLKALAQILDSNEFEWIDLLDVRIEPYQYDYKYSSTDEFTTLVMRLLHYEKIIFATPVYWYAMSGLMKIFIDRFTDLVTIQKKIGRQLKGKSIYLFAVGAEPALPPGFEIPFEYTARYFKMNYAGSLYVANNLPIAESDEDIARITNFTRNF